MNKNVVNANEAPKAIGPYSQAIVSNGFIYTSGQICINPETNKLNNTDFKNELNQVLKNLDSILNEAGSNLNNIIKCTIYLSNLDYYEKLNNVFENTFGSNPPARSVVEVSRLPKDVNVEIDAIAIIE